MAVPADQENLSPKRWQRVDQIFSSAIEIEASERGAFLARACGGDEALQQEVEALLESHRESSSFIESSAVDDALELIADESAAAIANARIGPYQIIRELNHGGMGAVYLASRADDQYKKEVAIKLMRAACADEFIVSRFLAERQILANLDHPNIAKLLDGGRTSNGSPYLVMEYIEGLPIDEYCASRKLSIVQRLNLFRPVCSAVAYAHRNLVIHRDLKPSNILVTADGAPKLLDFGIAKILEANGQTQGETATAVRMMTPDYASPEQVRGETITTATDIYSLGVLLYRLLTGCHPYRFTTSAQHEIEQVICETQPERPSEAATLQRGVSEPDESHSSSELHNPKLLRGDLDNIILKAMRKEPARRYASVDQFSEDIARHLSGLPVIARKDTFSYRSSKFITRHRTAVAASVVVILSLVAGIVATTSQARIARAQRDKARAEEAKSQRINSFLRSVLQYANPAWYSAGKDKGPDTTVLDALNDAAKRVDAEFAAEAEVRADLHHTIGDTYLALGFLDEAESHFQSSLETRRELFGENSVRVAESTFYLGAVQNAKGNLAEAERLCRRALAIQRLHPDDNKLLPFMIQELTATLEFTGDLAAAEPLDREALELFRAAHGDQDIRVAFADIALGRDYYYLGDIAKAEAYLDEALRLIPAGSAELIIPLVRRGEIHTARGEYGQAIRMLRNVADICRADYHNRPNEAHGQLVVASSSALIQALSLSGDYAAAKTAAEYLASFMNITRGREGTVVPAMAVMGAAFAKAGEHRRAEAYLREALARGSRFMVKDAWVLADARGTLGECLITRGQYAEAEALLVESYEAMKANQVPHSFRIKEASDRLARLYEELKKPELAARYRESK